MVVRKRKQSVLFQAAFAEEGDSDEEEASAVETGPEGGPGVGSGGVPKAGWGDKEGEKGGAAATPTDSKVKPPRQSFMRMSVKVSGGPSPTKPKPRRNNAKEKLLAREKSLGKVRAVSRVS